MTNLPTTLSGWRQVLEPAVSWASDNLFTLSISFSENCVFAQHKNAPDIKVLILRGGEFTEKPIDVAAERLDWLKKRYIEHPVYSIAA